MTNRSTFSIRSTAGAVSVRNKKGELSIQKVKVHRYVSGKRPIYAEDNSDAENEDDDFIKSRNRSRSRCDYESDDDVNDSRLRRLKISEKEGISERRRVYKAKVIQSSDNEDDQDKINLSEQKHTIKLQEDEPEAELSDAEIEARRELLKQRVLNKQEEEQILKSESDSSEYEEYTDSEEETKLRLKPIFTQKCYRISGIEKEKEAEREKQLEIEVEKQTEERRRQSLKMVEQSIKHEKQAKNEKDKEVNLNDVCTDEEDDEIEYEAWKLRQLIRIKRDREEQEVIERERREIEQLRIMTEEERNLALKLNPKIISNKAIKGKYKFMQKYYHRGVFYLDKEDEVFKRDFSQATLEDHFDKAVLPKVMQVRNFGHAGRSKYTHLVDQDTTQFDSPWATTTPQNTHFYSAEAGGIRQSFEKPSLKRRKI